MAIYKLQVGDLVKFNNTDDHFGIVTELIKYTNDCYIVWLSTGDKVKSNRKMTSLRRFRLISEENYD